MRSACLNFSFGSSLDLWSSYGPPETKENILIKAFKYHLNIHGVNTQNGDEDEVLNI